MCAIYADAITTTATIFIIINGVVVTCTYCVSVSTLVVRGVVIVGQGAASGSSAELLGIGSGPASEGG